MICSKKQKNKAIKLRRAEHLVSLKEKNVNVKQ